MTLELRDLESGETQVFIDAPMTSENRRAVREKWNQADDANPQPRGGSLNQSAALELFRVALNDRWAYFGAVNVDFNQHIKELEQRVANGITDNKFAIGLQKIVALGMDGHSGVSGFRLEDGYLPFLVEPVDERFVAFEPDRTKLVDPEFPYLSRIDGVEIDRWLEAASTIVPHGSPQYIKRHALRELRNVNFVRSEIGLAKTNTLTVKLESADGASKVVRELSLATRRPIYGEWPRSQSRLIGDDIGYLRISSMNQQAVAEIREWMPRFRETRGLIVDVRDNGGGSRDALREMFSYLMDEHDRPSVMNCAAYRLHPSRSVDHLVPRFMYRADSDVWTAAERRAIDVFRQSFRPEWTPPANEFSEWHYMVLNRLSRADLYHYDKPVIVLMNAKCFSATDIFLAGLKGWRNVTLLGTASGGGSARSETVSLGGSLSIRLASMASFQADGKLFDGHDVEPDVTVEQSPESFVGNEDTQLSEAVRLLSNSDNGQD